jgi:hypothetical protein
MRGRGGRRTTGIAALGAALVIAGCGGDAARTTTKAQFITKAAAVCRDVKQAQQPYSDQVDALPKGAAITRVAPLLEATLAESRRGLARLRALTSPAADRRQLDAYYAAAAKLLEAHSQLAGAARTNDRKAGDRVAARVGALSHEERRLATAYGLRDCDDVF